MRMLLVVLDYGIAAAATALCLLYVYRSTARKRVARAAFAFLGGFLALVVFLLYERLPAAIAQSELANRALLDRTDIRTVDLEYRIRADGVTGVFHTTLRCAVSQLATGEMLMLGPPDVRVFTAETPVGGRLAAELVDGITVHSSAERSTCSDLLRLPESITPASAAAIAGNGTSWPIHIIDARESPPLIVTFHVGDQPITVGEFVVYPPMILSIADRGRITEEELQTELPPERLDTTPAAVAQYERSAFNRTPLPSQRLEIHWNCWSPSVRSCSALPMAHLGDGPPPPMPSPSGLSIPSGLCEIVSDRLSALPREAFGGPGLADDDPILDIAPTNDPVIAIDRSAPVLDPGQADGSAERLPVQAVRSAIHDFLIQQVALSTPERAEFLINPDPSPRSSGRQLVWSRLSGSEPALRAIQIGGYEPMTCSAFTFSYLRGDGLEHRIPAPEVLIYPYGGERLCGGARGFVGMIDAVPAFFVTSYEDQSYRVDVTPWTGGSWGQPCTAVVDL